MIDRKKVDLASLYPTPKTYNEMETERVERKERKERNKPRNVPVRIGLRWTLLIATILGTYHLCRYIIESSLVSPLNVIVGICVALFVFMLGFAILKYLYGQLRDLLYNLQTSVGPYIGVFIVTFVGVVYAIWLTDGNWAAISAALAICFAATSLSVAGLERRFR